MVLILVVLVVVVVVFVADALMELYLRLMGFSLSNASPGLALISLFLWNTWPT